MADTGSKIISGSQLTEAKTPARLTTVAGEFAAKSVIVQALSSNTGVVVVGGADVVAEQAAKGETTKRKGIALEKGGTVSIDICDPAQVYIDVTTSKEGVTWIALLA